MMGRLTRKPLTWIVIVGLVLGGGFGLYWFQPWKLFTSSTVNEALPSAAPAQPTPTSTADSATVPTATPAPRNLLLARGEIIAHEHDSSGTASLVRLADGTVQLTLRDLATSDGPDLHVWLTDQPVLAGSAGWHVFDDGRHVDLGKLKANRGNQVYDVPEGTDLAELTSVTIWCARFSVSFGAATLKPV